MTSWVFLCIGLVVLSANSGLCDPGCPHFFTRHGSSCYHIFDTPILPWAQAMSFCSEYYQGTGSLAIVETSAEQAFLETTLKAKYPNPSGRDYWLGANDLAQESSWLWVKDDRLIDFSKWAPGQPSSGRAENCLALYDNLQFLWNDAPCNLPEAFICEVPAKEGPEIVG